MVNSNILIILLSFACFLSIHASTPTHRIDNLEIVIEIMKLNINKVNEKLQSLEEKYDKLYEIVEKQQSYENVGLNSNYPNQEDIRETKPQGDVTQSEPNEISYNDGKYTYHNLRISHLTDETKFCIRNVDGELECSRLPLPSNCADSNLINCWNNKCRIQNDFYGQESFLVPCDDRTEYGGGWTVIQRRVNNSVDFDRNWSDYKQGFGDIDGNYWIGLEKLYALSHSIAPVEIYLRLTDFNNIETHGKCLFAIGNENSQYQITYFGSCSGIISNYFRFSTKPKFFTKDQKNGYLTHDIQTGWWTDVYSGIENSNVNGKYYEDGDKRGIYLMNTDELEYAYKYIEIMIRPRK